MTGRIFINYRRGDDPGFTQALYQKLEAEFGREALFMDVEGHIKAGDDFVKVLDAQVAQSDILLAVIGPRWVAATDDNGRRRLDNPDDFVRIEIESAMEHGKRVIPVLVNNADMPRADELPEPMKAFSRRNARRLTIERFSADTTGLVKDLRDILEELEKARQAATEAERLAVEEAARRKQEEESVRVAEAQRQAEARAREQAAAGLTSEEIRKAEELASWEFIKSVSDPVELRNHLARFPGGTTDRYVRAALEEVMWRGLGASPTLQELQTFLAEFPKGKHAGEAATRCDTLATAAAEAAAAEDRERRETEAWAKASSENTIEAYKAFLAEWPRGERANSADRQLGALIAPTGSLFRSFGIFAVIALIAVGWTAYQSSEVKRRAAEEQLRLEQAAVQANARKRAVIEDKFRTALGRVPRECTEEEYTKYTRFYLAETVADWKSDPGIKQADCIDYYDLKE